MNVAEIIGEALTDTLRERALGFDALSALARFSVQIKSKFKARLAIRPRLLQKRGVEPAKSSGPWFA